MSHPIRRNLTLFLLAGCFPNVLLAAGRSLDDETYLIVQVGYTATQRIVRFKIPSAYSPQVTDGFFRIIARYPSMEPSRNRPDRAQRDTDDIDIMVTAFPKNGTEADGVIEGRYRAQQMGGEDGYTIYTRPLGKTGYTKYYGWKDVDSNNVIAYDPGGWSSRYHLTHGLSREYVIKCYFSKKLKASFLEVDASILKLISSMYIG